MYIDILILSQILKGPKHGYEIKRKIECNLGNNVVVNNNMLYPALRHFEDQGIIRKVVVAQKGKPSRTVYHATPKASRHFKSLLNDFPREMASNQKEFFIRVIFLSQLNASQRRRILASRKSSLESQRARISEVLRNPPPGKHRYFSSFMEFIHRQMTEEILWVSKLERIK
jgi:DNA-binding PadR family transcriptional regulator